MREIVWQVWDDLDNASGRRTRAQATVKVGFEGKWWELDLGAVNLMRLQEDLRPYIEAGRPVKGDVSPPRHPVAIENGKPGPQHGLRLREWEKGRDYGKALREFARENGYSIHVGTCTCASCRPDLEEHGEPKLYYSRELRDAYAASIGKQ